MSLHLFNYLLFKVGAQLGKFKTSLAALSVVVLFSTVSHADNESFSDRIQIHGFATQGLVFTSDNNFYGDSDHGSADFTELGLNASFQITPRLRASGQVLSRHAGDMDDGSPRVDFAMLDLNLISSPKGRFGLYFGREKSILGLYNETRDVSHTRQGVFTAQTIYFDKTRDLSMSGEGIHFYSEYYLDNGTLHIGGGMGYALPDVNTEITFMGQDWAGSLDADDIAKIGRILYEHDSGRWIFSLTTTSIAMNYKPAYPDTVGPLGLSAGSILIDYTILSTEFNGEKWQVTGELGIQNVKEEGIGGLLADIDTDSLSMAVQVGYQWTPKLQTYLRREAYYIDKDDKYGKEFEKNLQAVRAVFPSIPNSHAYDRYTESWVIGSRWDITNHIVARADFHLVEGTAILSGAENDFSKSTKYWNMFAMSLSYRF